MPHLLHFMVPAAAAVSLLVVDVGLVGMGLVSGFGFRLDRRIRMPAIMITAAIAAMARYAFV